MRAKKIKLRAYSVFLGLSLMMHGAPAQSVKQGSKSIPNRFDAQAASTVVDQIIEIVGVCQTKAEISASLKELRYQAAYGAELAKIRYELSAKGLEVRDSDRLKAQEKALQSIQRAPGEKDVPGECKSQAKNGMDQEVKSLILQFSDAGLSSEVKAFVAAWYTSLQAVGTDRFKEHQIRLESLAETLKLEATMRNGK